MSEIKKPRFLNTLLGLALEPRNTLSLLFSLTPFPYVFSILFSLFFITLAPIIYQFILYGSTSQAKVALGSLFIVTISSILLFLIFESWLIITFGVEITPREILALISYSSTPMILVIFLVYLYNYSYTGGISLLSILVSKQGGSSDELLRILPFLIFLAQLDLILIFFLGIRFLGKLQAISALLLTFLSGIPLYGAVGVTLFVGEVVSPGVTDLILELLKNPLDGVPLPNLPSQL